MQKFQFAALQGEYAKKHLPRNFTFDLKTLVVQTSQGINSEGAAILMIINELSFPWSVLKLLNYLPLKWLNGIYRLVSRNRFRFFKQYDQCLLPDSKLAKRFLK